MPRCDCGESAKGAQGPGGGLYYTCSKAGTRSWMSKCSFHAWMTDFPWGQQLKAELQMQQQRGHGGGVPASPAAAQGPGPGPASSSSGDQTQQQQQQQQEGGQRKRSVTAAGVASSSSSSNTNQGGAVPGFHQAAAGRPARRARNR